METENSHSHNPVPRPHRLGLTPHPGHPIGRRPAVDGFAPRRSAPHSAAPAQRPGRPIPVTSRPAAPTPRPQTPQPIAVHQSNADFTPRPAEVPTPRSHAPEPLQREFVPDVLADLEPAKDAKPPKERSSTGHSGLVGFLVFILLGALLVSPFVPGTVMQNFPLSSSNFSTGDQALACLENQGTVSTATAYGTKAGAPLTYRYSTSTTQSAVCNGKTQTAVTGHTSQSSPLALLVDVAVALVVAIVIAKVWRRIFGEKRQKR